MTKNPYIYIAGPFFNDKELDVIEKIKMIIETYNFKYFSPKDELMYKPGVTTPEDILRKNVEGLIKSDLLIVVTDGKDPGTMFEAGWAYAKGVPMIYVWLTGTKEQKFNVMLAATGSVVRSFNQLFQALDDIRDTGEFHRKNWGEGEMMYE
jgi:nucleoside 2-deoxyribosyltransferase